MSAGKGDRYRSVNIDKYNATYDRIVAIKKLKAKALEADKRKEK